MWLLTVSGRKRGHIAQRIWQRLRKKHGVEVSERQIDQYVSLRRSQREGDTIMPMVADASVTTDVDCGQAQLDGPTMRYLHHKSRTDEATLLPAGLDPVKHCTSDRVAIGCQILHITMSYPSLHINLRAQVFKQGYTLGDGTTSFFHNKPTMSNATPEQLPFSRRALCFEDPRMTGDYFHCWKGRWFGTGMQGVKQDSRL